MAADRPPEAGPMDPALDETEALLFALAQAVEERDHGTARHCEHLALIGVALGTALGLDRADLLALYRGGFLHDVGKVALPDAILFKHNRLTEAEWAVVRIHPLRGEEICRHVKALAPVLPIIRHHHERWDGSGYPDGLRGEQIPLLARLLQIADIYDALTSPRPYKPVYPAKQALRILDEETVRGWRDPQIVTLFFRLHRQVICRIVDSSERAGNSLEAMRSALDGLVHFARATAPPALR